MKRRSAELETREPLPSMPPDSPPRPAVRQSAAAGVADVARYGQELEERYVAARDAWTKAMHAANSGRAADMASLAIAQQAYETIAAEREQWLDTGRVAIPIEPPATRHDIEIAVDQGMAWRRVQQHEPRGGLLSRIMRRIGGR